MSLLGTRPGRTTILMHAAHSRIRERAEHAPTSDDFRTAKAFDAQRWSYRWHEAHCCIRRRLHGSLWRFRRTRSGPPPTGDHNSQTPNHRASVANIHNKSGVDVRSTTHAVACTSSVGAGDGNGVPVDMEVTRARSASNELTSAASMPSHRLVDQLQVSRIALARVQP